MIPLPGVSYVSRFACLLLATLLVLAGGCSTSPTRSTSPPTPLHIAHREIPEDELLDVGILVFDTRPVREGDKDQDRIPVAKQTREAEARFIPYHLKNTLQDSGEWGAVRVIPTQTRAADLMIKGEILRSDGAELELEIAVEDATGRRWFTRSYDAEATEQSYAMLSPGDRDAFQDVYNAIANDLLAYREGLTPQEAGEIRTVATLRYAADLLPDPFEGYLQETGQETLRAVRLPARDDPVFARMLQVREREYALIDTVNDYYDNLYLAMWDPYQNWRRFYREESIALDEVKRKEMTRKALGVAAVLGAIALEVLGKGGGVILGTAGVLAYKSGMDVGEEAEIHEDSIRELDASFNAEVEPLVVEVDGKVVELQGSAETQFQEWRRLLHKIYLAETGLGELKADIPPAPGSGSTGGTSSLSEPGADDIPASGK